MIDPGPPLSKNGRAAVAYGSRGLYVFPCHHIATDGSCSCGSECASPGKHPRVLDWENLATPDDAQIRSWWARWPLANIGCAAGRTGWIVIDTDPRNGGDDAIHELTVCYGSYVTARSLTGGGGTHDVFALPKRTTFRSRSTAFGVSYPGVDVKSAGGYVLLPPSNHKSGQRYQWEADTPEIAELPSAWAHALKEAEKSSESAALTGVDSDKLVPDGMRHTVFVAFAGRMRRSGMGLPAIEHAVRALNAQQCEHPMDERELEIEIKGICGSAERWPVIEPLPHGLDRDLKPRDGRAKPPGRLVVKALDEIPLVAPEWLWRGRLPSGELSLLFGDGGVGKSTIAADILSRITTGTAFLRRRAVAEGACSGVCRGRRA